MNKSGRAKENEMTTRATRWEPWMGVLIALTDDGMTQEQLSGLLGWDPSKLSRIISGVKSRGGRRQELKISEIMRIAEIQDRPISWYLDGPNYGMGVSISSFSQSAFDFDSAEFDPVEFAESYADTRALFQGEAA